MKKVNDSSLNITSPYPLDANQLRLSHINFLQKNLGEVDQNYQLLKQQATLMETHLKKNSSIEFVDYVARPTLKARLTIGEVREKVEQLVGSEENNFIKINQLKQLEKEQYKPLIQHLAYKKSLKELQDLVIVLKDLGYLTTKLGELSGELNYYTEAAIFYQYVITILNEKLNEKLISKEGKYEFLKQEKLDPHQQLTDIQQLIFLVIGGDQEKMPVVQEEAQANKDLLLALRNNTDLYIELIESNCQQIKIDSQHQENLYQEFYVNAAKELIEYTSNELKKFLAKLYSAREQQIATAPPCKYAIVGLGSMAL